LDTAPVYAFTGFADEMKHWIPWLSQINFIWFLLPNPKYLKNCFKCIISVVARVICCSVLFLGSHYFVSILVLDLSFEGSSCLDAAPVYVFCAPPAVW